MRPRGRLRDVKRTAQAKSSLTFNIQHTHAALHGIPALGDTSRYLRTQESNVISQAGSKTFQERAATNVGQQTLPSVSAFGGPVTSSRESRPESIPVKVSKICWASPKIHLRSPSKDAQKSTLSFLFSSNSPYPCFPYPGLGVALWRTPRSALSKNPGPEIAQTGWLKSPNLHSAAGCIHLPFPHLLHAAISAGLLHLADVGPRQRPISHRETAEMRHRPTQSRWPAPHSSAKKVALWPCIALKRYPARIASLRLDDDNLNIAVATRNLRRAQGNACNDSDGSLPNSPNCRSARSDRHVHQKVASQYYILDVPSSVDNIQNVHHRKRSP